MSNINNDIFYEIFSHLPINAVLRFSTLSKTINTICSSNHLWEKIFERDFGEIDMTDINDFLETNNVSSRDRYIAFYKLYKSYIIYTKSNMLNLICNNDDIFDFSNRNDRSFYDFFDNIPNIAKLFGNRFCDNISQYINNLDYICFFTNLEALYVYDNKFITKIDDKIARLNNLTYLCIDGCPIRYISPKLFTLTKLRDLKIGGTKMTNLNGIERLKNLSSLDLSNNQIKNIDPIYELTNLNKLTLTNNKIKEIKKDIAKMKNLNYIVISYNPINNLPKEICKLYIFHQIGRAHV